jgi:D-proline reductase (dithiol) PrdB
VQSPLKWSDDHAWKADYCNVALLSETELARRRQEFNEGRRRAKELRKSLRPADL